MACADPPEHKELSQMAATREAFAGAAPSKSAALVAVASTNEREFIVPIGMLLLKKNKPHCVILD
jgi:hypothetical protein